MEGLKTIDDPAELVKAALRAEPDFGVLVKASTPIVVASAIDRLKDRRRSMIATEADFKSSPAINELRAHLSAIGAKLAPTMDKTVASAWIDALCISLSKWPASVALGAAKRARHEPIRHGINGADEVLHRIAAELDARQGAALSLLVSMRREIERSMNQRPMIEERKEIWTQASIDEANELFRRIGARTRYELVDGECVSNLEPLFTIEDAQRESAKFDRKEKEDHISNRGGNHEEE